jgi:YMGG-like Gly-zipper
MTRRVTGIIGAALLATAALIAESQTQPAEKPPASASATSTQPVSQSLGLVVYPAKGQTASQQSVDEQECYNWAKTQTGIDPAAPPPAAAAAPEGSKAGGQRVRGAARGAAAGAIIGEVADNDADEGAKVGAAAGVLAGGHKAREDKRAHEQQAKEQVQASETERKTTFKKAVGTCLQGRGYTTG